MSSTATCARTVPRPRARAAAVLAAGALALTGCGQGGKEAPEEGPDAAPTAEEPAGGDDYGGSDGGGDTPDDLEPSDGADDDASDGGGEELDPTDPSSHYLFVPVLGGSEELAPDEVTVALSSTLEAEVELDCPSAIMVDEQIECTGSVSGEGFRDLSDTWDIAMVPTTNDNVALIVRAAGEDAGDLPIMPGETYHFAYLVGQEPTPETVASTMEEGFKATQVSDGPAEVDVTAACQEADEEQAEGPTTKVCEVEGSQPADAAGTWHGIGHDSFIEESTVYLFVQQAA